MDLRGKRVLITGASGFIGGRVAVRIADEEGSLVRGFARRPDSIGSTAQITEHAYGDMADRAAVRSAVEGCDVIIHCAAKQFPPGTRKQFLSENVGGFENLARAALECGVRRMVHLSTINVHGFPPPPRCNQDSPLRESGDYYSDSKVATERLAARYLRETSLPLVIIRPACTYGPGGGAWTLTPLKRVQARKRVLIADGSFLCNPVYVDNLVDLIFLALKSDNALGESFIGSDGIGIPWRDFYSAYARMLHISHLNSVPLAAAKSIAYFSEAVGRVTGRRPWVSMQSVAFYSHRVVYDISKTKRMLGYEPRVTLEKGMELAEQWLRATGRIPS